MASNGWRQFRWWAACALILWSPVAACAIDSTPAMREDAQLNAVCFADADRGWAVGDRGVIWHTTDGGAHWALQASGVDARLESVSIIDSKNGWAAGGWTQPYTSATHGVLLRTRDGGKHWSNDQKLLLPAVRRIKFFDTARGWAIAEPSAMFSSGVFTTEDGGRSWTSLPTADQQAWIAGDFSDPLTGALVGHNGAVGIVRRRGIENPSSTDVGLRSLRQLKLAGSAAWLVGDGGVVMRTEDFGRSWQTPEGELPRELREQFDFAALEVRGSHLWVAGSPGTMVLHSPDGGRTWKAQRTGQQLPLRDLTFVDESRGWAVGDLGLILSTTDGGHTWKKERAGGARAALLAIYSQPQEIPLELVARLAADEGFLTAVEIVNRQDFAREDAQQASPARVHEAVTSAGGSSAACAWRFPLRDPALKLDGAQLVEVWNRSNDGQGLDKLEAHVVGKIRLWRPEVVVTSAGSARSGDAAATLINQVVLRAVDRAADPAQYAGQASAAGLAPWKVKKVYCTLPPGETSAISLSTSQIAPRVGRSLNDAASLGRGLLAKNTPPPQTLGFRLLVDHIPQGLGQRDFFSGVNLQPGGDARRALGEAAEQGLDAMRRSAQAQRNLQAILSRAEQPGASDARYLAEMSELTRGMDINHAADLLYHLAQRYYRQGRWEAAAETFDLLANRYPNHALAAPSLVWLTQYYSSGEAAWRCRQQQQYTAQQVTAVQPVAPTEPTAERAAGFTPAAQVRGKNSLAPELKQTEDRPARAVAYAKQLELAHAGLFAEPEVRFPLAVAHRNQSLPRQSERYYLGVKRSRPHDAWWNCAQGEAWLAEPKGMPPKSIWKCIAAGGKPRLDGKLDEACWRLAPRIELRSPQRDDEDWPAMAMLTYDEEFLYWGVSVRRPPGAKPAATDAPRPRDANLAEHDRVELYLDVDRDYATYYRLSIDDRGWTADACWHDTTWNPRWFVAAREEAGGWSAEAALPLSELCQEPPVSKHGWAVGAQRIAPGVGFQSWTTPAATEVRPEGFGFLLFE